MLVLNVILSFLIDCTYYTILTVGRLENTIPTKIKKHEEGTW